MRNEDEFKPKLGKPRAKGEARERSFRQEVLRSIARAGGRTLLKPRREAFTGKLIGRGAGVGRVLADRPGGLRARRVVIKARIAKIGAKGLKAAGLHLRYIQRDGVTREGAPGELYDAGHERADGRAFLARAEGDRHQFRFIVAAEDADEYEELKSLTRRLMTRVEDDLGTKLDWVAVDHFNTGHPHTHIIVRGKDEDGKDLIIAREYISHGMRQRASEIVTLDLGPRSDLEIERRLTNEVAQDRLTSIDQRLLRDRDGEGVVGLGTPGGSHDGFQQSLRAGRLQHLGRLGLASEVEPGRWRLAEEMEVTLKRMGERDDIIKTMNQAISRAEIDRAPADLAIFDPARSGASVAGRLIERGFSDATDRHYIVVDGMDGRAHWIDIGAEEAAIEHIRAGAIVSVRTARTGPTSADRTIAEIAAANGGHYSGELHQARDPAASPEFIAAHVRRLEALRRLGIGAREPEDVWHVPDDFLDAVEGLSKRLARQAPVTVEVASSLPVGKQVHADGATWLDRRLIGEDRTALRDAGFGREVKAALTQRRHWLIAQKLAEERQGQIVYRANLLAILRHRELTRIAAQVSRELSLSYAEYSGERQVAGKCTRRLDLVSGRFAVIERVRDFTLVPWRPVLERSLGQVVSGIAKGATITWEIGRTRTGPTVS